MSIFSKAKKLLRKVETDVGIKDKPKKPAPYVDPDPINPLSGRPMSQNGAASTQGLGQVGTPYLPQPVSMSQRIPQGLGSAAFRSTLAPLQQQGYGLGQVDPRFLQSQMQQLGGENASIPFARPGEPPPPTSVPFTQPARLPQAAPVEIPATMMYPGMTSMQSGLGRLPIMRGGLGYLQ